MSKKLRLYRFMGTAEYEALVSGQRLTNNTVIKIAKPFVYAGIVCLVIATFLPSTKQGYMIYGVSNTIEYIKSNEKAKELPDKVVMALDKWLEREINDEKGDSNEQD